MEEDKNFTASGFPTFDDIEIEEPEKKSRARLSGNPDDLVNFEVQFSDEVLKRLKSLKPEELLQDIPPELLSVFKAAGEDPLEIIQQAIDQLNEVAESNKSATLTLDQLSEKLLGRMFSGLEGYYNEVQNVDDEDEEDEEGSVYELSNAKHISADRFGSIPCQHKMSSSVYEELASHGVLKMSDLLEHNIQDSSDELAKSLNYNELGEISRISTEDDYEFCYASPKESSQKYGIYLALYRDPDGKPAMLIPEFRNTFQVEDEHTARLYNLKDDPDFLVEQSGNIPVKFADYLLELGAINFAIKFELAPVSKDYLLTLHEFGTMKNVFTASLNKNSRDLHVANITPNLEDERVRELIRIADFDEHQASYPVYFDFGELINGESLLLLEEVLFHTDLNTCKLLDYKDVKFKHGHLYIDVDLGEF